MNILLDTLLGWTPLALAALGALFSELAGMLCICVEGFITLGSFVCYLFYIHTESIFAAVFLAALVTGAVGGLLAVTICKSGINPFVGGLAFNLAADAFCAILSKRLFGSAGVLRISGADPSHLAFFLTALAAIGFVFFALYKTRGGLRLRAVGLSQESARESGLDPDVYKTAAWTLCAAFSAVSGAAVLFRLGAYIPYGSAGRGWLALAAVFMGFKKPHLSAVSALLFALASVLSAAGQKASVVPQALFPAFPYITALIFYVLSCHLRRVRFVWVMAALILVCGLCSCTDIAGKIHIAKGSVFYSQGDYERSAGNFMNAFTHKDAAPYAAYSLGAAYLAMDEGETALKHFGEAERLAENQKSNRELLYRLRYNSGIVRFQQEDYQGAANFFRYALLAKPHSLEAKRNLELSLLSVQRQAGTADVQSSRMGGIRENKNDARSGVLLDFMRRRETEMWKSIEWSGDEASTADY
ncbi:MAG: hypothetical protein LBD20_05130 [Spirochaetaceae bacterium]|jgi:ABC-type uncharacterized transport system permease subunit|nr:hypothetical protein [Spirochaetaceae bacterium]